MGKFEKIKSNLKTASFLLGNTLVLTFSLKVGRQGHGTSCFHRIITQKMQLPLDPITFGDNIGHKVGYEAYLVLIAYPRLLTVTNANNTCIQLEQKPKTTGQARRLNLRLPDNHPSVNSSAGQQRGKYQTTNPNIFHFVVFFFTSYSVHIFVALLVYFV